MLGLKLKLYFDLVCGFYFNRVMKSFFQMLKTFFSNVASDARIPRYDKKIIIILTLLVIFPLRYVIQGFAPMEPFLDFLLLAFISDYFFEILDPTIILSHYPWSMKSFSRIQRIGHFFAFFAIDFIKNKLWKYKRDPF